MLFKGINCVLILGFCAQFLPKVWLQHTQLFSSAFILFIQALVVILPLNQLNNMKKALFVFAIALLAIGCNQEEIDNLTAENQRLDDERNEADSLLAVSMEYFNRIHGNLQAIKEKEGIISLSAQENIEFQKTQEEEILEDITMINDLMVNNKNRIAELEKELSRVQNQLNKKGKQYAMALKQIEELKGLIANYETMIEQKEMQIVALKQKLVEKDIEIERLNVVSTEQSETISTQVAALNQAFYAVGSKKELKDNNIVSNEGGVLGIGAGKKLSDDFNRSYFTEIDITKTKEIPLFAKKAKLVTSHPVDSYEFSGEDGAADKLIIKDPKMFWSASKYLVVVVM